MKIPFDSIEELSNFTYDLAKSYNEETYTFLEDFFTQLGKKVDDKELANTNGWKKGDWLAVVKDSHCTVGMGGPGCLWQLYGFDGRTGWLILYGRHDKDSLVYGYDKEMFRLATQEEIDTKLNELSK